MHVSHSRRFVSKPLAPLYHAPTISICQVFDWETTWKAGTTHDHWAASWLACAARDKQVRWLVALVGCFSWLVGWMVFSCISFLPTSSSDGHTLFYTPPIACVVREGVAGGVRNNVSRCRSLKSRSLVHTFAGLLCSLCRYNCFPFYLRRTHVKFMFLFLYYCSYKHTTTYSVCS